MYEDHAQVECLRDKSCNNAVVILLAGYSEKDIEKMLRKHPEWYRSTMKTN